MVERRDEASGGMTCSAAVAAEVESFSFNRFRLLCGSSSVIFAAPEMFALFVDSGVPWLEGYDLENWAIDPFLSKWSSRNPLGKKNFSLRALREAWPPAIPSRRPLAVLKALRGGPAKGRDILERHRVQSAPDSIANTGLRVDGRSIISALRPQPLEQLLTSSESCAGKDVEVEVEEWLEVEVILFLKFR